MADLPSKIFIPLSGRRSNFYNVQPLRSGQPGSAPTPQQGFLDDADTVAVYLFEGDDFITLDSFNGNTLTNNNGINVNASETQEGSFSASLTSASTQYFSIAPVTQSSNFPLKNGASNTIFSITWWMKLSGTASDTVLWSKESTTQRSVRCSISSSGTLQYQVHTGVIFEDNDSGISISTGTWYHCALEINHDSKAYKFTVYNDSTASETITTITGSVAVPTPDIEWNIGSANNGVDGMSGFLDEYSMTARILGSPDVRQIRQGTYDGPLDVRVSKFGVQTLYISPEAPVRVSKFGVQVLTVGASGTVRVSTFGVQALYKAQPSAVKIFPLLPSERVTQTQSGKRVFPV